MYTIAVVEDEHLESQAICQIIEKSGRDWQVVATAYTGTEALEKIEQSQPDIVLLDIHIPEIDGLEVLRRVKKENPARAVIIITAFNEFEFAQQAIKAHVDDFLLKPIRPEQLYEAVDGLVPSKDAGAAALEDKKQALLYAYSLNNYWDMRTALKEYLCALTTHYSQNVLQVQQEIEELLIQAARTRGRSAPEQALRPSAYQNRYQLFQAVLSVLNSGFDDDEPGLERGSMESILNYIDRNCKKDLSLNQVGDYANMSSYYLSKIFKKETGVNFVTYLTERKIELAKDMLIYTELPIINIALELSYHEPNYFSKVFKKSTDLTPTEYRKQYKK